MGSSSQIEIIELGPVDTKELNSGETVRVPVSQLRVSLKLRLSQTVRCVRNGRHWGWMWLIKVPKTARFTMNRGLIIKFRICCNWQFASTVVTIATDTTWNIVAMWHHDQQIALIHHDLNKEWTWDLICIIRKSFEIFILFKLKIHYSLSMSLSLFSLAHSRRLSV